VEEMENGWFAVLVQQLERNMMQEFLSPSSNWNQKFKLTVEIKRREELNY
jgi:hypothetical protein